MKIKLLALIALALILAASQPASADDKRTPVVIDGMKELPLRVLTKPYAKIYQKPEEGSPTVQENLSAFQPFYVYSRPGEESLAVDQGWYEVGVTPTGKVVGWMKSLDVFEWRQTMCLAYTHPDGRKPVLMFEQKKPLLDLIKAQPPQRSAKANEYYNTIGSGQVPPDFPVESVEPKKAVDISKQFYLLPILQHEAIEIDGREGRLLRLAAVTGAGPKAREASDIRKNQDFLNKSNENATLANSDVMKDLKVDLVFVIDTTRSMAPYIKATLDMVRDVTKSLSEFRDVQASMHMGLWGYRDSMEDIPQIGYTTKNFTPQLQPVDQFEQILSQMQVTMVDSRDWAEDVFSGVNDAISMTAWNEDSIRIMVLMGDAAGHEAGHKRNLSGHTPDTLRAIAQDHKVHIYAVHIKPEKAPQFHAPAEEQFKALSQNRGAKDPIYVDVNSSDVKGFKAAPGTITMAVMRLVAQATNQLDKVDDQLKNTSGDPNLKLPPVPIQDAPLPVQGQDDNASVAQKAQDKSNQLIRAALVEWIGSKTQAAPPRDVVAWVVDKDLIQPAVSSLEVRLLVNKRQLDSMRTVLSEVMAAGIKGQVDGDQFFSALQATSTLVARDPDQIKNAQKMAETGLIPEFLMNLPYHSRLMEMNNDLWASWSVDEQDEFLNEMNAKIEAYESIHDRPDGWIALNRGDDPDDHVYPISLELLP